MVYFNFGTMDNYFPQDPNIWSGRRSDRGEYLHEIVRCISLEADGLKLTRENQTVFALLGFACDEGVRRNQGRPGAAKGPEEIRKALGKMANHLTPETVLLDAGNIICENGDMEGAQSGLSTAVGTLLQHKIFPVLLGGGHEIAYGHFKGIHEYVSRPHPDKVIGIINLDAHFDLRKTEGMGNSGTPFYQISEALAPEGLHYLCLGIQKHSNSRSLYETAIELGVEYIEMEDFHLGNIDHVRETIVRFIEKADYIYLTIDLDGFSSDMAPGVSAPSPFGFSIAMAREALKTIYVSGKLISVDIAELNPLYDIDCRTAKLGAGLVLNLMQELT